MKKMLALSLVLVLASTGLATTAGLSVAEINGAPYDDQGVQGSDLLKIVVTADFDVASLKVHAINDNGVEAALGVVQAPYEVNAGLGTGSVAGSGANMNGMLFKPHLEYPVYSFQGSIGTGSVIAPGAELMSFIYHVPEGLEPSTIITIEVLDQTGQYTTESGVGDAAGALTSIDSLTVHVIPEPMTMGLLAIGGLVALRRRRA
jgi:hypothetical protein